MQVVLLDWGHVACLVVSSLGVVVGSESGRGVFAFGGHQAPLFLFVHLVFVLVAEFMVFHIFVKHEQSDK